MTCRPPRRGRTAALALLLPLLLALPVACQPVEDEVVGPTPEPAGTGAPGNTVPSDLPSLLTPLGSTAQQWQDDPRAVEVLVELDGEDWVEAIVTYLAPDADRLLQVSVSSTGTRRERPTLATLDLLPVTSAGLAEVPPLPDVLEPVPLAEAAAAALEDCGVDTVVSVLYAAGVTGAWQEEGGWVEPPRWTATLADGERAVVVDPLSGRADPAAGGPCLDG